MPEGVGYGPQYTASTGLELNYIGSHVYAHSGSVGVTNAVTDLLSFTTGAEGYIVAKVTIGSKAGHGDDMSFLININGTQVYTGYEALVSMPTQQYLNILLPPGSNVEVKAKNEGSSSERLIECVLVGRIYK